MLIGGLASLLSLARIGWSVDTRFLMATMIFCSLVVATATIMLGAAMAYRIEKFDSDKSQRGDTRLPVRELDEEVIANRVVRKILFNDVADDFVGNRQADELTARTRRRPVKSVGSKKRR